MLVFPKSTNHRRLAVAKETVRILHFSRSNDARDADLVYQVAKKFFSPKKFTVGSVVIGDILFDTLRDKLDSIKFQGGHYDRELPIQYVELEIAGLVALEINTEVHLVVGMDYEPTDMGPGVASHLGVRALFLDGQRGGAKQWNEGTPIPFLSEVVMPYIGPTGATPEQVERGKRTVLRNVIEGWKVWSERQNGIAKQLTA